MTATPTYTAYREVDPDQYAEMQNSLLRVKGSSSQREFLQALKDAGEFLALIEDRIQIVDGRTLPMFDDALTESSFKEPTEDQEARMYALWHDIPPRTACRVSFWASVTLEHIRDGKIPEATWLAANGGITESGEERVDRALALADQNDGHKAVDECVRTVFRRMSGLPSDRGNRSVFVNPTFGRGWWRERIVAGILERGDAVEERSRLLAVVRRNQEYWERVVSMIVSRGSVFGSADVQAALVNSLARRFRQHPNTPLRTATTLTVALRRISNLSASQELGVLEFHEINALIEELLERVEQSYVQ